MCPTLKLENCIKSVKSLGVDEIDRMFELMINHYENVNRLNFEKDLFEKDGVLIISDECNLIQGFSTYKLIHSTFQNKNISAIFSGDTVLNHEVWGTYEPFKVLGKLLKMQFEQGFEQLYWFLISKGHRTYQLLPLFFKHFYPSYKNQTPEFESELIDHLSILKFGDLYNQETKLISTQADYLKPDLLGFTEKCNRNKHINHFVSLNPNYAKGEELPCIAKIEFSNLTNYGLKFVSDAGKLDR
jgi:hypothetical protein